MRIIKIFETLKKNLFLIIVLLFIQLLYIKMILIGSIIVLFAEYPNQEIRSYHSNEITINLYDAIKNNRFKITADHITYLHGEKIIWFTSPEITIFYKHTTPIWKISCKQAKLIEKNVLDLYGYVYINKIINNKCTQSIISNHVLINFIDQNMVSNDKTIIHGYYFYSIGSEMYVDFKTQIIKLFGKIYTQYEIKRS